MGTRELTLTLPEELTDQLQAGEVDDVSAYVSTAARAQVRREAIRSYLSECEAAGHEPLTDKDVNEFHHLVGEDAT